MRQVISALGVMSFLAAGNAVLAADLRYFEDAALRAVQFVDNREGWAVGDEGVVWHTIDGGRNWERQPTASRASLRSLHFLNPFIGWIAGREELPHGQGSVGVLLFTKDGGTTWKRLLANAMPGLNRVRFIDPRVGFVFGDGSDQFPTGVFKTADGGQTWEPVPGPRCPSWLAGEFLNGTNGILAGAWSRLATLRNDRFAAADVESLGGRSVHGVLLTDQRALAVGEGGMILTSKTQGARWGFADLKLTPEVLANLDFQAIHGAGRHVWVVGRPGSVVLHSADQGGTWKLHKTGQALPLYGVFFLDDRQGWAVGELGTILASDDGGQSWKVQHRGGRRAALLLVHARPMDVPVETLARLGAEEGYLTAVLRVLAPDPASAELRHAADSQRFAVAVRLAGGAAGEMLWQFPLPQHLAAADKQALLSHWNQQQGNEAGKQMLRQLVLALRAWRPDVVVTDHPDARASDHPAGALVAEAVHEALAQAADPAAFAEQIDNLGLQPFRPGKVYALWDKKADCQVIVDGREIRPRLQASAGDHAAAAAALLADNLRTLPPLRFFRLLESRLPGAAKQAGLLDGIALAPGGEARRALPEVKENPDALKAYRERRNLETLAGNMTDASRTLAQIQPLLARLPDDQGAAAALALANLYVRKGQWDLARETFLLMVDRYPAHPLSAEAYRWLIRHASSSEARRRHELEQFLLVTRTTVSQANLLEHGQMLPASEGKNGPGIFVVGGKTSDAGPGKKPPEKRIYKGGSEIVQEGRLGYLNDKRETRQWYRGSLEFAKRLSGFGPLFASDPGIQFCLQASRRNLGQFEAARNWYQKFKTYFPKGPWHDAAAAELWLDGPQGPPPKPLALCVEAPAPPFLDGRLDDPCWKGHKPIVLNNAAGKTLAVSSGSRREGKGEGDYTTEAWLAHDQEFLYIALRCRHPAGQRLAPVKPRPRDADLRAFDRVSILLDLDRDYATYFHLQIDQRGCLREDCWGDATWNPRWFVAIHSTDTCWQIEAALPLSELTGDRIRQGTAWAVNIVRILPGRGVQAFSLPADLEPRPEGMGLLLFAKTKERGR